VKVKACARAYCCSNEWSSIFNELRCLVVRFVQLNAVVLVASGLERFFPLNKENSPRKLLVLFLMPVILQGV
jgi:hypothetical protein